MDHRLPETPWFEKYRPTNLCDLLGNGSTILRLKSFVDNTQFPNLMIYGPSGVGKTSAVSALLKEWKETVDCLLLNASDDRGVESVRRKIKEFVCKKSPGLRLVILDEADNMTEPAQHALKSIMDTDQKHSRFVFCCNDLEKILKSLKSRCVILNFEPISDGETCKKLREVCISENISISNAALQHISKASGGDLRCAINRLQCIRGEKKRVVSARALSSQQGTDTLKLIIYQLMQILSKRKRGKKIILSEIYKHTSKIWTYGFELDIVCEEMFRNVSEFPEHKQLKLIDIIRKYNIRIVTGIRSKIQLFGLVSEICQQQ